MRESWEGGSSRRTPQLKVLRLKEDVGKVEVVSGEL